MNQFKFNPLEDEFSELELVAVSNLVTNEKYNIDQMPLLAARISSLREGKTGEDPNKDIHLLSETLAQNKHMTPFEHIAVTFRVVAPIFVFREWHRHRTQSYNEMSARYLKEYPMRFYIPKQWRKQSSTNKQGSANDNKFSEEENLSLSNMTRIFYESCAEMYDDLKTEDVASELARIVLPVGIYSEMYATANLRNWFQFYELRAMPSAQWEIRQYANAIGKVMEALFPQSWGALNKWHNVGLSDEEINHIIMCIKVSADMVSTPELDELDKSIQNKLSNLLKRGQ